MVLYAKRCRILPHRFVNHGSIFRVFGILAFLRSFFHRIHNESTTAVEHASEVRVHFAMVRRVHQGCLLAAYFYDGFCPSLLGFMKPFSRGTAPSLIACSQLLVLTLMILQKRPLIPNSHADHCSRNRHSGLDHWHEPQTTCEALNEWVTTRCLEFREIKMAQFAKYIGASPKVTSIGGPLYETSLSGWISKYMHVHFWDLSAHWRHQTKQHQTPVL